jgi:hypothetical protein
MKRSVLKLPKKLFNCFCPLACRYGVTCAPLPGTKSDPYSDAFGIRQFYNYKRRLPVEFIDPSQDKMNLDAPCFKYKLRADDTVASVVDALDLTMEEFVLKQMTLNRQGGLASTDGSPWSYENVTYKLGATFDVDVLDKMLRVADDIFRAKNQAPYQPYLQCWYYDPVGVQSNTTCDSRTGASACLQYGNGTVGCALHYANIAVPETLAGPDNNVVTVCNVTHPYFENPKDSQVSAHNFFCPCTCGILLVNHICMQSSALQSCDHLQLASSAFYGSHPHSKLACNHSSVIVHAATRTEAAWASGGGHPLLPPRDPANVQGCIRAAHWLQQRRLCHIHLDHPRCQDYQQFIHASLLLEGLGN